MIIIIVQLFLAVFTYILIRLMIKKHEGEYTLYDRMINIIFSLFFSIAWLMIFLILIIEPGTHLTKKHVKW